MQKQFQASRRFSVISANNLIPKCHGRSFNSNFHTKDAFKPRTNDGKGQLVHVHRYDVKGVGGASFFVAPGSTRNDGETYTIHSDTEIRDIPDWLVDWLQQDHTKHYSEIKQQDSKTLLEKHIPAMHEIDSDETYKFILSRATSLGKLGLEAVDNQRALNKLVIKFCEKGADYVSSAKGKATIKKLASKAKVGHAKFNFKPAIGLTIFERPKPVFPRDVALKKLIALPDSIASKEATALVQQAVAEAGFELDLRSNAGRKMLSEARKQAGYAVTNHTLIR